MRLACTALLSPTVAIHQNPRGGPTANPLLGASPAQPTPPSAQADDVATTIPEAFRQLRSNLEITGLQRETVSTRQQRIREAVERGLTLVEPRSFLTGSYLRSTMIGPLAEADVDIFVVLSSSYFHSHTPRQLLEAVRGVLEQTYPRTPRLRPDERAVTIRFNDFTVDVVPSFNRQGGGYLIPDARSGKWISTDPTVHTAVMTAANADHQGQLIPIVKMIKGWNKAAGGGLSGLYLEFMTREVLTNVKISDDPSGVRFVLGKGIQRVARQIHDPAGFNNQINPLKTITLAAAVDRFASAHRAAVAAEQAEGGGRTRQAFDHWRGVFGSYFPAYG